MTGNSVSMIVVRECPSLQKDKEHSEDKREHNEVAKDNEHAKDKRESIEVAKDNEDNKDKRENLEVANDTSRWKSLYTLLILAAFIANTFVVTWIPRNNSILFPEYWYEALFPLIATTILRTSCSHILDLFVFTKEKSLLSISHFAKVYIISAMVISVAYCTSYVTWTLYLGHNHPMPFLGMLQFLPEVTIYMIAFWFCFHRK